MRATPRKTPLEAKITVQKMNLAESGFIDPAAGISGVYMTPTIYLDLDRLGLRLRPGRGGAGCRTAAAIGWRSSDLKRHHLVAPQVAARDGRRLGRLRRRLPQYCVCRSAPE